jgi:uncharacterized protein GlcG (DUF336 family)
MLSATLYGCSGGGSGGSNSSGNAAADSLGIGGPEFLTATDVTLVVSRAATEATARGTPATIAVVDRVGNVLAVSQMPGATTTVRIRSAPLSTPATGGRSSVQNPTGLEEVGGAVATPLAAIAKAISGAYLSSNGNGFTTRTASEIVQEFFPPYDRNTPNGAGPLFGVQFSQLPCSDLSTNAGSGPADPFLATDAAHAGRIAATGGSGAGPHRSPLGLSADPGGLPLYKNGTLVGGVGVVAGNDAGTESIYGLSLLSPNASDPSVEEQIAFAGSQGLTIPDGVRAERINIGFQLQAIDDVNTALAAGGAATVAFPSAGAPSTAVAGYYDGTVRAGTSFIFPDPATGAATSGFKRDPVNFPDQEVYVLVDPNNGDALKYPPIDSTTPAPAAGGLSAAEVRTLLQGALSVAFDIRAAIRRPSNVFAQVTVSVVDTDGNILGIARTPDAPVFGTDVSLQKARTAMFFSRPAATGAEIAALNGLGRPYLTLTASFLQQSVPTDTTFPNGTAFSEQSIGNLARPFFPDISSNPAGGPLSRPYSDWSIFSTGLQEDLVQPDIVARLDGTANAAPFCGAAAGLPVATTTGGTRLSNGTQIFAGGLPIYRTATNTIIGGIGVSGDGITQDSMIGALGMVRGQLRAAAAGIAQPAGPFGHSLNRASKYTYPSGGHLIYLQCPPSPFVSQGLNESNPNPCGSI